MFEQEISKLNTRPDEYHFKLFGGGNMFRLALIAPGGRHMLLKRSGAYYCVEVMDGPLVNRHRSSVDVVFGMPKEAIKLGGVDRVVVLQDIPREIMSA